MKKLTILLAAILGSIFAIQSASAAPTAAEYGTILNLSGKQRMLTQKMSKELLLAAKGYETEANLAAAGKTAALFNRTLTGLKEGDAELGLPPTEEGRIVRQLGKVEELWAGYYPVVQAAVAAGSVSPEAVAKIEELNLPLLKQMNKGVKLYERASKDSATGGETVDGGLAITINLAGKQRMLTQKMSKEYTLIALGQNAEDNKLNLLDTYTLFGRTLQGLKDGDETLELAGTTQPEIRAQLEVVEGLWTSFQPLMAAAAEGAENAFSEASIAAVASQNVPLLKNMNKAVKMYEGLAK